MAAFAVYDPLNETPTNSTSTIKKSKEEKVDTGSEEERLKKLIKEQEEKIRVLELQKKATEQQKRLEELSKSAAKTTVAPAPEKPSVHPIKQARIELIKKELAEKPERESDILLRGLQKWDNHDDRKKQKKVNGHIWGKDFKMKNSKILKMFNAKQLDMVSPPAKPHKVN